MRDFMDIPYVRLTKERLRANIQYAVLFLEDRLLFVKIGGQFAEGGKVDWIDRLLYASSPTAAYMDLAKGKLIKDTPPDVAEAVTRDTEINQGRVRDLSKFSITEILAKDKVNFEVPYCDVTAINIDKPNYTEKRGIFAEARSGNLAIEELKKKEKYLVSPVQNLEECVTIFEKFLPGKVKLKN
jgi:hypothetical protein